MLTSRNQTCTECQSLKESKAILEEQFTSLNNRLSSLAKDLDTSRTSLEMTEQLYVVLVSFIHSVESTRLVMFYSHSFLMPVFCSSTVYFILWLFPLNSITTWLINPTTVIFTISMKNAKLEISPVQNGTSLLKIVSPTLKFHLHLT